MPNVPSSGWWATVTHPDTSRILRADALSDPRIEPSINALARIRYPVPRSDQWQTLTGQPAFDVFVDGDRQPIDELIRPIDERDNSATVLEGRGGVELLDEAAVEFDAERRHLAAQQVIQNQTPYDDDIATPSYPVLEDQDMQDPSTTSDFNGVVTFADDEPATVGTDEVPLQQTLFFSEGEDYDNNSGTSTIDRTRYSGNGVDDGNGQAEQLTSDGEFVEFTFTTLHDIPEADIEISLRAEQTGNDSPGMKVELDGTTLWSRPQGTTNLALGWHDKNEDGFGGDLAAGSHTVRCEVTATGTDNWQIDCVTLYDTGGSRFDGTYNFDNTVEDGTDGGRYLDGPRLFSQRFDVVFNAATTPFSVIAGTATVSMNDINNGQRVQLTTDRGTGKTWEPSNGDEDNTASVTVDPFASASDRIQLRVGLSYTDDTRTTATPQEGFNGQHIDSYDLDADIRQESLILDYNEDKSVEEILNDIVGQSLVWSYRVVDGTGTVTVTQPGQRASAADADLIEAEVTKDLDTVHEYTVRGSNKTISGEQFDGSTTFKNLTEDDIIPASESVRDPTDGTQFTRGDDYEMDWSDGQIRITDDGAMASATTYEISYRAETKATHTDPNAPAGFQSRTVDIPGVISDRNAEQIAFVLVSDLKDPRWVVDVTVPPGATTFDVVESLALDALDVPDDAGPFFATEPPRQTPRGIEFRLESAFDQARRVRQLQRQVSAVARRTG